MKNRLLYLAICLLLGLSVLLEATSSLSSDCMPFIDNKEIEWRIGGKIHFEEESGTDYVGIKAINQLVKESLKNLITIKTGVSSPNTKIMLKKDGDQILMTHYEEKSRPGIGEEMHATLLYTQPRGFCNSETLKQICESLFKTCNFPPSIETVAKTYSSIIKPEWKFKISEVVLTKNGTGSSFIIAKLLFDGQENICKDNKPISAGLHMTLVNSDDFILEDDNIGNLLISNLNKYLKGKFVKIAERNGIADLEFGMSGSTWRVRAEERIK